MTKKAQRITVASQRTHRTIAALPVPTANPSTPFELLVSAVNNKVDPATLQMVREEYQRWREYEARLRFDEAWSHAQVELPIVFKKRTASFPHKSGAGHTSYQFESFDDVVAAVRPVLAKYGLSYLQTVENNLANKSVTVTTQLTGHGHREQPSRYTMGIDETGSKNPIQALGSAQTYGQRYTLKAALGLAATQDDDANGTTPTAPTLTDEHLSEINDALKAIEVVDPTYRERLLRWVQLSSGKTPVKDTSDIREDVYAAVLEKVTLKQEQINAAAAKPR